MLPPKLRLLLVFLAACHGGAACFAQAVDIELRPAVVVSHAQVTLADVAELNGDDRTMLVRLRAMPLGAAPRVGSVRISRAEIDRWIRRHATGRQPELRWTGAAEVEVSAARQRVAGSEIEIAARAALQRWLEARSERSEIGVLMTPADVFAPAGDISIAVREPTEMQPRSRMQLWAEVSSDGQVVRTVPVSFSVRAYRTAYVALQDIGAGRPAGASQFESRQVDVAAAGGTVEPARQEAAQHWQVRQQVRGGQVLLSRQVDVAPAVTRGQMATLRTQAGMLTVENVVEVMQDGHLGQLIKVKAAAGTGAVMARVAGPGLLEMTER